MTFLAQLTVTPASIVKVAPLLTRTFPGRLIGLFALVHVVSWFIVSLLTHFIRIRFYQIKTSGKSSKEQNYHECGQQPFFQLQSPNNIKVVCNKSVLINIS
jgi:hypothetical protein